MTALLPRPEHPRPDFMRPNWINLNGEWQFSYDDDDRGLNEKWYRPGKTLDRTITVPFCYQCEWSGVNEQEYHPILWYRRSFEKPNFTTGHRILLRFGAVDFSCAVYVNGQCVGTHKGGYTPFVFDITPYLLDDKNDLCLRVEDACDCTQPRGKQMWTDKWFSCWYTPTSSIWQSVYLEEAGSIYVKTAHITPDIDKGTAEVRITLNEIPASPLNVKVTVTLDGQPVRTQTMTMNQRSQRMVLDMVEGAVLHQLVRWTPANPKLYDVHIETDTGDDVTTYFGMRKVHVADGRVLLNNKPIYQRLVLDQGYWPQTLITPPSNEAIRADVEWTLKLGYNGARKHQKLEDPRYYYWADKLGLLVWEEIPSAYEYTDEAVANTSETLTGGIERDFNHPSVITWVPVNESWGMDRLYANKQMQASANMLYYQVKALDGTRVVSTNDGWECVQSDIFGLHDYAATGEVLAKHFADRDEMTMHACDHRMAYCDSKEWTGKEAFLLTEYGGIAFEDKNSGSWGYHDKVSGEEAFFERYQSVTDAARAIPYCQGYVYTQLTDVQQEKTGILTPERKPKVDVNHFRELTRNPDGRYQ